MRSILSRLRALRLVLCMRRGGCFLTPAGERVLASLRSRVASLAAMPGSRLSFGRKALAVHLKGAAAVITRGKGLSQRDAALMAGAFGTTSLVYNGRRLALPCGYPIDQRIVEPACAAFELERGDAVILCYAADSSSAERGLWAAIAATL